MNDKTLIPFPKQFLTPRPNIDALDPEEMYDMREGPSQAIDPNLISASWTLKRSNQKEVDEKIQKRKDDRVQFGRWRSKKQMSMEYKPHKPIDPKKRWFYQKNKKKAE